ncbi:MAG TPA: LysR family transcriptional regulator, partial [Puia sp.]|nr:LysR family transcriptional regulator [Puia sp.]
MNITLHQLTIFSMIVEKKSITKAAEELNMTQPAVSIQLKKMQDQFEIALTEVIGRKIFITDFGLELYRMAEKVLGDMEDIRYRAENFKGVLAGKLRVSVVSTGKYILPYFLSGFLKDNPGVDLRVDVTNRSEVIRSLEDNEVDYSLVSVLPSKLQVMEEIIMPNRWYLVGPKDYPLPARQRLDKSVFSDIPLIFREEGSGTRYIMQQYFKQAGIVPKISLELASDEAVKQAVMAGLGLSILSILTLKNELKQKEIKIVPVRGLPLKSDWRLIWLKRKKPSLIAQ